ncbi:SBBP repeat-containing protein [Anoxybacillus sp. KU2-6(11)]|uniref:SBBP repeat-containing protein n=1 Tax=Anoxybacillus sp. KU2-6(11) TaxID=1535751 RepID=UPI00068EAA93|nr:SBBP repeat-containing protein [Anoxybacillus sp. KU2-6(11)]
MGIRNYFGIYPSGKYRKGSILKQGFNIVDYAGGMGNEIWSKTDVSNGYGIAVDSAGNVYVAHNVAAGGKVVRKLDANGNEIWSKTDVDYGYGIAVDSAGSVYVGYGNGLGSKTVRS